MALDEPNQMKSAYFTVYPGRNPPPQNGYRLKSVFFVKSNGFISSTFPIQLDFFTKPTGHHYTTYMFSPDIDLNRLCPKISPITVLCPLEQKWCMIIWEGTPIVWINDRLLWWGLLTAKEWRGEPSLKFMLSSGVFDLSHLNTCVTILVQAHTHLVHLDEGLWFLFTIFSVVMVTLFISVSFFFWKGQTLLKVWMYLSDVESRMVTYFEHVVQCQSETIHFNADF